MWRATISGILARKVRLFLTALAVVLGVTFVSGTYVLTDTLHASLGEIFQQYASGSDLVVAAKHQVGDRATSRQRIPSSLATEVAAGPGGGRGDPVPAGRRQADREGRQDRDPAARRGHARDLVGRRRHRRAGPRSSTVAGPLRDGEVAIDAGTARRYHFTVGDKVRVLLDRRGRTVPDRRPRRARRP